jgi:hypothetical protein
MKMASQLAALMGAYLVFCTCVDSAQAESAQKCGNYANRAIQQFNTFLRVKRCNLAASGRWHANFKNHCDWCLSVPLAWLNSEQGSRDIHLHRCGGHVRYDDNNWSAHAKQPKMRRLT